MRWMLLLVVALLWAGCSIFGDGETGGREQDFVIDVRVTDAANGALVPNVPFSGTIGVIGESNFVNQEVQGMTSATFDVGKGLSVNVSFRKESDAAGVLIVRITDGDGETLASSQQGGPFAEVSVSYQLQPGN